MFRRFSTLFYAVLSHEVDQKSEVDMLSNITLYTATSTCRMCTSSKLTLNTTLGYTLRSINNKGLNCITIILTVLKLRYFTVKYGNEAKSEVMLHHFRR